MAKIITTYDKQANDFLQKTGTKFKVKFLKNDYHFADDKDTRDIYRCTLTRNGKSISINFGQSMFNTDAGIEPTAYNLLTCVQKYDVGTFENFCSDFGYDTDSIKATKIYKAVVKEYAKVSSLFNQDELEQLQEIQ